MIESRISKPVLWLLKVALWVFDIMTSVSPGSERPNEASRFAERSPLLESHHFTKIPENFSRHHGQTQNLSINHVSINTELYVTILINTH